MRRILLFLATFALTLLTLLWLNRNENNIGQYHEELQSQIESPKVLFSKSDGGPYETYTISRLNEPLNLELGYGEFANRIRLLEGLYPTREATYDELLQNLFPWILPTTNINERAEAGTRGIVMCVGNEFVSASIQSLLVLKHLNSSLPVVISHAGNFDLDQENRQRILDARPDVQFMDLCKLVDCIALDFDRWDSKPFALLASPFEETILMDADAVFVQRPEVLLSNPLYLEHSALFFKDRTLFGGNRYLTEWITKMMPKPLSKSILESRIFGGKSNYEQESGVVVVNVKRHLFALLATCFLNTPGVREEMHAYMHGEKETFWMGFELADHRYTYMPGLPGSIGRLETVQESRFHVEQICGHLAHFDHLGRLLWFNDGLSVSKKESDEMGLHDAAVLTHIGREGTWTDTLCIRGNLTEVSPEVRLLVSEYRETVGLTKRFVYNFESGKIVYQPQ